MRKPVLLALSFALVVLSGLVSAGSASPPSGQRYRWDVFDFDFSTSPASIVAGGSASANARDGSTITVTGSGSFGGAPDEVTGGGTWATFDASGNATGHGTYRVLALVGFYGAPGASTYADRIGDQADARAGLATFLVAYSNGVEGLLTVSVFLPGSPIPVFEGVTASMGPIDYWQPVGPVPEVRGGRTIFHLLPVG